VEHYGKELCKRLIKTCCRNLRSISRYLCAPSHLASQTVTSILASKPYVQNWLIMRQIKIDKNHCWVLLARFLHIHTLLTTFLKLAEKKKSLKREKRDTYIKKVLKKYLLHRRINVTICTYRRGGQKGWQGWPSHPTSPWEKNIYYKEYHISGYTASQWEGLTTV